ncbi:acetyl-coenzyme-A carboxylase, partial [Exophiala xenobiotica]
MSVVYTVLSHTRVSSKNNLIVAILAMYRPNQPNVGNVGKYFKPVLRHLTELESRVTAKVTLKARELLILCALPSLEERVSQMEHILKSSVVESKYGEAGWEHREPDLEILKEVVDSRYTVFDVIPLFFAHHDPWVGLAALEVYIRRAYRAYTVREVEYHNDVEPPFFMSWDFVLRKVGQSEFGLPLASSYPSGQATPSRETGNPFKRISSVSDLSYLNKMQADDEPTRKGVIAPCHYLDEVE